MSHIILQVVAPDDNIENLSDADIEAIHNQLNEAPPGTAEHMALTQEQKDVKRIAKRVVKVVKEMLEDATRKEAELRGRELEEEIKKLDSMGIFASAVSKSLGDTVNGQTTATSKRLSGSEASAVAGASPEEHDTEMLDADERTDDAVIHLNVAGRDDTTPILNSRRKPASKAASHASSVADTAATSKTAKHVEPLSPPISRSSAAPNGATSTTSGDASNTSADSHDVFAHGGVPWYLEPFDPVGTTIHEERYTGRAVLRDMSEELSELDDETLNEIAFVDADAATGKSAAVNKAEEAAPSTAKKPKKKARGKRTHWSKTSRS